MNSEKTFTEIKKSIIEFDIFKQYMFGFIGKTDLDLKSFWLINQSNIYKYKNGYRFSTFRRFEGRVIELGNKVIIEGEFKIRPLFKISMIVYMIFFILLSILGAIFPVSITGKLKIISLSGLMMLLGIGIAKFKIHKTQKSEVEIIKYIEDVIN
jgi:hypothetical protein